MKTIGEMYGAENFIKKIDTAMDNVRVNDHASMRFLAFVDSCWDALGIDMEWDEEKDSQLTEIINH